MKFIPLRLRWYCGFSKIKYLGIFDGKELYAKVHSPEESFGEPIAYYIENHEVKFIMVHSDSKLTEFYLKNIG